MFYRTEQLDRVPEGAVVHFIEKKHPKSDLQFYNQEMLFCHANCGTYGGDLIHTTDLDQVTCGKCLRKFGAKAA